MLMMSHPRIKVPHSKWRELLTALLFDLSLITEWTKLLDSNGNHIGISCFYQVRNYCCALPVLNTGFIQASLNKIQGLFKDF